MGENLIGETESKALTSDQFRYIIASLICEALLGIPVCLTYPKSNTLLQQL